MGVAQNIPTEETTFPQFDEKGKLKRVAVYTTSQLCVRYGRNYRTIRRWQLNDKNPFPLPLSGGHGTEQIYLKSAVIDWELKGGVNARPCSPVDADTQHQESDQS